MTRLHVNMSDDSGKRSIKGSFDIEIEKASLLQCVEDPNKPVITERRRHGTRKGTYLWPKKCLRVYIEQ